METSITVQLLGILTLIIFVVSLQQRKKEAYLLIQTFGTLLFIVQYILTGKYTGAVTFTVVAIRGLVFYYYKKKGKKPSVAVLVAFLSAIVVSTVLTWQNILSIIPFIATASKTWGTWQDGMKTIRRVSLLSQGIMIVYNMAAGMYTGALTEVCNLASTAVAIWRYDRNKRGKDPAPDDG